MKEWKNAAAGRGLYILVAVALCALGMIGALALRARQTAVEVTPANAQEPVVVEAVPKKEVPEKVTLPEKEPAEAAEPTPEPEPIAAPQDLLPQVISPLDGTTMTVFSMSELLYDTTMADWRTHAGIDIQAAEGDAVKTAASGEVVSVKSDELMGNTVVIQHAGGYTTQYSSLLDTPPVSVGQKVSAGDVIGYVGTTATAEVDMGPHLHFSVSKDGKVIDPGEYVR